MRSITLFPFSHHLFKQIGLAIALAGLVLFMLLSPPFQLLFYSGLVLMVFSREKHESETIQKARAESFKSVFGFTICLFIALHLTGVLSDGFIPDIGPFLCIGLPLLLYLLLFHTILLIKININSSLNLVENIRNHKRFYIIWFTITLLLSTLYILRVVLW
ncbi:MAG: hypothetical protein K8R52_09500 [Bacteroidales bacterium]|nr:hypothetical protein [Bacteroidales bacterium]